jgi:hypothetical protein
MFDKVYRSGRLILDDNMMERISKYCQEDVFLEEIGVIAREKRKLETSLTKKHEREDRYKRFQQNIGESVQI